MNSCQTSQAFEARQTGQKMSATCEINVRCKAWNYTNIKLTDRTNERTNERPKKKSPKNAFSPDKKAFYWPSLNAHKFVCETKQQQQQQQELRQQQEQQQQQQQWAKWRQNAADTRRFRSRRTGSEMVRAPQEKSDVSRCVCVCVSECDCWPGCACVGVCKKVLLNWHVTWVREPPAWLDEARSECFTFSCSCDSSWIACFSLGSSSRLTYSDFWPSPCAWTPAPALPSPLALSSSALPLFVPCLAYFCPVYSCLAWFFSPVFSACL